MKPLVPLALVVLALATSALADNPAVTVTVDAAANRHPINPLIYGVHFADKTILQDLNATLNRYGGNSSGRYNWDQNIDNRGVDYFFESIPYDAPTAGEHMDTFIGQTKDAGAQPFLTMPMGGSVAKTNVNRDFFWSFDTGDCPGQNASDGPAGNGCIGFDDPGTYPCEFGTPLRVPPVGCNPFNASIAADHLFQKNWVQHIVDTWGTASTTGLKFWGTDNEPSIWHDAYFDVHPQGASDVEVRDKIQAYVKAIKQVDAAVQALGPEEWGWDGYFYWVVTWAEPMIWSTTVAGGAPARSDSCTKISEVGTVPEAAGPVSTAATADWYLVSAYA